MCDTRQYEMMKQGAYLTAALIAALRRESVMYATGQAT